MVAASAIDDSWWSSNCSISLSKPCSGYRVAHPGSSHAMRFRLRFVRTGHRSNGKRSNRPVILAKTGPRQELRPLSRRFVAVAPGVFRFHREGGHPRSMTSSDTRKNIFDDSRNCRSSQCDRHATLDHQARWLRAIFRRSDRCDRSICDLSTSRWLARCLVDVSVRNRRCATRGKSTYASSALAHPTGRKRWESSRCDPNSFVLITPRRSIEQNCQSASTRRLVLGQ